MNVSTQDFIRAVEKSLTNSIDALNKSISSLVNQIAEFKGETNVQLKSLHNDTKNHGEQLYKVRHDVKSYKTTKDYIINKIKTNSDEIQLIKDELRDVKAKFWHDLFKDLVGFIVAVAFFLLDKFIVF